MQVGEVAENSKVGGGGQSNNPGRPAARRARRVATGRFSSREQLTCHVWSIHRQQVYPNIRSIAEACGVSMEVVKTIIVTEEGLSVYLEKGCPTGN